MGATYRKRGKHSFLVTVHADGLRQFKTVRSEQDAKALVQYVHKQELAGVNVVETIRQARAARATVTLAPAFPPLREALPEWIERQTLAGEIRGGTPRAYRSRLATWFYPAPLPDGRTLGDLRADELTREMIGAVIRRVRESGRSLAIIQGIRNPLSGYYRDLIETKQLRGPSPASDLRHFIGRRANRKAQQRRTLAFFTQEEGPQLFATARAGFPRWYAFLLTGVFAGLRWGESAALYKEDIDWTHGRLHIQRTFSDRGRVEAPKDGEGRWVSASPALMAALRSHVAAVDLEGQVKGWTPEQRRLVFPNTVGRIGDHGRFVRAVWQPLSQKAGLPYRKYHATRHTFATWMLEGGADLRWVQEQMGHASIEMTAGTYGHCQPARHHTASAALDRFLSV